MAPRVSIRPVHPVTLAVLIAAALSAAPVPKGAKQQVAVAYIHAGDEKAAGAFEKMLDKEGFTVEFLGKDAVAKAVRYYTQNRGLDDPSTPTMRTLERLLQGTGVDVSLGAYGDGRCGVFLTNAVLCLKLGGLQAPVQKEWFVNCGRTSSASRSRSSHLGWPSPWARRRTRR